MIYKIYIANCGVILWAKGLRVLPNRHGGVRSLELFLTETIWTGSAHLDIYGRKASCTVQVCDVSLIESRSSVNEDDEKWKKIFELDTQPTTEDFYKFWNDAAKKIEREIANACAE